MPDGQQRFKSIWWIGDERFFEHPFERVAMYLSSPQSEYKVKLGGWTIGTLPTSMSALQLLYHSAAIWYNDTEYHNLQTAVTNWTLQTSQPVVLSECSPEFNSTEEMFYFRSNGTTSFLRDATELYNKFINMNISYMNSRLWASMPHEATSLIGLFVQTWPKNTYFACSLSSFWRTTVTSFYLPDMGYLVQSEWLESRSALADSNLTPITIDSEGLTLTQEEWEYVVPESASIAALFMGALTKVPGGDELDLLGEQTMADMVKGYDSPIMNTSTTIKIDATISGFGYGSTDTTTRLSLAVITAYCMITVLYMAYIITTGRTSIAWNSATELIILALRSKEPNDLGHVSVGLDSMDTLCRSVGIRVHAVTIGETGEVEEKLELVFEHDDKNGTRALTKVDRNKAY